MRKGYFSKNITDWYRDHHRDLPWRNTPDPYKIWLSEIILQQTRVVQGLPYYQRFIQNFPTIKSLAEAKEQAVLRLWQGLGYYTRARNLHKCAREVVKKFNGKFPHSCEELKQLPGIGDYTAAAIASFAFQEPVAVIDGNVYRVLSRIFGIDKNIASSEGKKFFSELANKLIDVDSPGQHNQAIMEFGALHCLPQNPKCEECTFSRSCFAFQHGHQGYLPVKISKPKAIKRHFTYFVIRRGEKILLNKRISKDIWKGLFDFPLEEENNHMEPNRIVKKNFPHLSLKIPQSSIHTSREYRHVLSHQIILARFLLIDWPVKKELPSSPLFRKTRWFSLRQIGNLPKPVLITRYLDDRGIL